MEVLNIYVFWTFLLLGIYCFFNIFSPVIMPFFVGLVMAYVCVPHAKILKKYLKSSSIVALMFTISLLFICIFILNVIIPALIYEIEFFISHAPEYYRRAIDFIDTKRLLAENIALVEWINSSKVDIGQYLINNANIITTILKKILSGGSVISTFFSSMIIIFISFYYFLSDWDKVTNGIFCWIPIRYRHTTEEFCTRIRNTLDRYFYGQLSIVFILSCYYSCCLSILGIEKYILIGIISGFLSFIPFIGSILCMCVILLIGFANFFSTTKLMVIFIVYVIGQFFEGYVLSPKFVGREVGLHPLWLLFSFFAGYNLGGVMGVLIAIPTTSIIGSIVRYCLELFKKTAEYKK